VTCFCHTGPSSGLYVDSRKLLYCEEERSEGSQSCQTVNVAASPVGLGTKDHCAGEGQQQFTGLDCYSVLKHYIAYESCKSENVIV
jgi:hypothetical protein